MFKNRIQNNREVFIINADDFGYNASIDRGIIELIVNQHIKSVSVIVNGSNISQVAQFMSQLQKQNIYLYLKCSFGLHINMTEGRPFSLALTNTTLCQKGVFIGKGKFYELISDEKMDIDKMIEEEIRLQIEQFVKLFKRRPSHIDGHNHIHLIPKIAKILAEVMNQSGIYRVRTLNQSLKEITIQMNHTFIANNAVAFKIYQGCQIIHPIGFVGLESFGNLQPCLIENQFKRQDQLLFELKSVELMCHPGYPDQNGLPWVGSSDRLSQKKSLQSNGFKEFIQKRKLFSYLDLQYQDHHFTPKLLIYSKLNKGTGNYTTTLRLKKMFQKMGFRVYLWSASDLLDLVVEASDLSKFLRNFGISIIVGVNVSRSARIIYQATIPIAVPFIFVIAGTDANITFKKPELIQTLQNPLRHSQCLISLSSDMTSITQETLINLGIKKKVYTIVQSTCLSEFVTLETQWKKPQKPYIILPTSFRKVKCVHHLLNELNQIIDNYDFQVYIAGPILDENYYNQCKIKLGKVKYLGVLSKQVYAQYLKWAFVMINTSESEGMSCSILEAFQFQVPVIARSNSGNLELIKHQQNGLIYDKPSEFIQLFLALKNNCQLLKTCVQNGYSLFQQKYSCQKQFEKYKNVLDDIYFSKLFSFEKDGDWVKILNQQNIHPASLVNCQLFQQIQPLLKPKDKIIDIGSGTGIFISMFLIKTKSSYLDLYLTDIEFSITANAVYNIRQSSIWKKIGSITYLQSDLFDKIDGNIKYDVVLFNPPQTPFRNSQSKPDKNGGPNAIKFYEPILRYLANANPTKLYLLHSYMGWPEKLKLLINENKLHVVWKSQQRTHKIHRQAYRKMELDLDAYIIEHMREGKAKVVLQNDYFLVPAVIYCIEPL